MVKEIVKDTEVLTKVSRSFDRKIDSTVIDDLVDTAKSHIDDCLGLAAIQIGEAVRCFVIKNDKDEFDVYINPVILKRSPQVYQAEEGCLSLEGVRQVTRNDWVDVIYSDAQGKYMRKHLTGIVSEVFQHEFDHLYGRLI